MNTLLHAQPEDLTWIRRKHGKAFAYYSSSGKKISSDTKIKFIKSLAIPPSWKDVKISPTPKTHLQATGVDLHGKLQYLYHSKWGEVRNQKKNRRLAEFGKFLPKLRKQIAKDLLLGDLSKARVIAAALRLIDLTAIRVGNEASASRADEKERTYGLTTLKAKHISVRGKTIQLKFKGKSGVQRELDLQSKTISSICKDLLKLKGKELFSYLDEKGEVQDLKAKDLNDYISSATDGKFTAKDFRTWRATLIALDCLHALGPIEEEISDRKYAKRRNEALGCASAKLGNTIGMCKSHYVNAYLFEADRSGRLRDCLKKYVKTKADIKFKKRDLSGLEKAALRVYELSLKSA